MKIQSLTNEMVWHILKREKCKTDYFTFPMKLVFHEVASIKNHLHTQPLHKSVSDFYFHVKMIGNTAKM